MEGKPAKMPAGISRDWLSSSERFMIVVAAVRNT
jgi:hypothetical protein